MAIRRGADYIKALRDGREVWHAGKRIADVTAHPRLQRHDQDPGRSCTTSSMRPSIATS